MLGVRGLPKRLCNGAANPKGRRGPYRCVDMGATASMRAAEKEGVLATRYWTGTTAHALPACQGDCVFILTHNDRLAL